MNKILFIGLGKLGLIFSFILASKNNYIYGYDINKNIIKDIKEPGNYIGIMPAQNQNNWAKSSIFIKKRG